MTQERWDVSLRFLGGPLAMQGEMVWRGPLVRIGANPGPDGLRLEGYRGLDHVQATISAYDSGTASVAPVGRNQVRLAPHEHVDWNEVHPLRGPAHLTPGCAIHFGPPGRGATCIFVDCRRLGDWQQRAILSAPVTKESIVVKEVDTRQGMPLWFLPGCFGLFGAFVTVLGVLLFVAFQRKSDLPGPLADGTERQDLDALADVSKAAGLNYDHLDNAYAVFVSRPNALAAEWPELAEDPKLRDEALAREIGAYEVQLAGMWKVWAMFERALPSYVQVLDQLRLAKLPDALAAIPFQESAYLSTPVSPVCAKGWWQFMPETAVRAKVAVRDCSLPGASTKWTPTALAPVMNSASRALYVSWDPELKKGRCIMPNCDVDERTDLHQSTLGAIELLRTVYDDPDLRASGSLLQLVIASHNAGYDDSPYRNGVVSETQVLPAWKKASRATNLRRDPKFFGSNLSCRRASQAGVVTTDPRCGGAFMKETQNYVPLILAYHFLAVCYYGKNHDDAYPALKPFGDFTTGNGYCKDFKVPSKSEIENRNKAPR